MNKHATRNLKADKIVGGVATDQRHDSAHKHVTGEAVYIDDMPEPAGTLHAASACRRVAHGTIDAIDLAAVRAAPGVVDVLTAEDIPGENDISPTGRHDEPVLADGKVQFHRPADLLRDRRDARAGAARRASWRRSSTRNCRAILDVGDARSGRRQARHAAADARSAATRRPRSPRRRTG